MVFALCAHIFQKFEDVRNNMINQCNFQSGLHPFKEDKKTSSMADIMTPVHIVSQLITIHIHTRL